MFLDAKPNVTESSSETTSSRNSGGRPGLSFAESSERSKRRKVCKLREEHGTDELSLAVRMSLRSEGAVAAAKVIEDVTTKSPTRADKYRASMTNKHEEKKMSPDVALALLLDSALTRAQYQNIRSTAIACNSHIFPSYRDVLRAKKFCYQEDMHFSETCAEVALQSLLNHTCYRIIQMQHDVIDQLDADICKNLLLVVKWGSDGSSGQSEYKQSFADESSTDSNVLLTSLVPLQLSGFNAETQSNIIVWQNSRPSSPWFCRPIRLQFKRETKESTIEEKRFVDEQIESLTKFDTFQDGKSVGVNFKLIFTMIDGKVCNVVTETTSSMRCYLCKATSKNFNDIEAMKKLVVDTSKYEYGLSTLHWWIRLFECLLHVGYKKEVEKWQSRGEETKQLLAKRKAAIQKAFKDELHLIIDRPKPGMGNSNDGNTARRFFEHSTVSARILGIDIELVERFHIILQVLSSGFNVKVKSFEKYCHETAQLFVSKYKWYNMSTTVHKVLIHGPNIIEASIMPIGQLSEEAQESQIGRAHV